MVNNGVGETPLLKNNNYFNKKQYANYLSKENKTSIIIY